MIAAHLIITGVNLVNVSIDAYRITVLKVNIRHFINFGFYLLVVVACCWWFDMTAGEMVLFGLSAFFNRQNTFDIPLNLSRHLPINYVTTADPPGAVMDRLEIAVFGRNGTTPMVIYMVGWILTLIIEFT